MSIDTHAGAIQALERLLSIMQPVLRNESPATPVMRSLAAICESMIAQERMCLDLALTDRDLLGEQKH